MHTDATPRYDAEFGQGSGPVVLQHILCRGSEQRLIDCTTGYQGISNCRHSNDAGVICVRGKSFGDPKFNPQRFYTMLGCTAGEIRLAVGTNHTEGRLEICLNNEWGTVCNQTWSEINSQVVCRQLGLASTGAVLLSESNLEFLTK